MLYQHNMPQFDTEVFAEEQGTYALDRGEFPKKNGEHKSNNDNNNNNQSSTIYITICDGTDT